MRYKEFKEKIEDWGKIYDYKTVVEVDRNYIYIEIMFEGDGYPDTVCEIHKSERFVIDLNWESYRSLSDEAEKELLKIVIEFAATKPEDREDRRIFRFEISAHTGVDIIAGDLNEARKRADEIWHDTFKNGLFGDVRFIKEVKGVNYD